MSLREKPSSSASFAQDPHLFFSLLCYHYFPPNLSNNLNKKVIQPLTGSQKEAFPIQLGPVHWLVRALGNPTSYLEFLAFMCFWHVMNIWVHYIQGAMLDATRTIDMSSPFKSSDTVRKMKHKQLRSEVQEFKFNRSDTQRQNLIGYCLCPFGLL